MSTDEKKLPITMSNTGITFSEIGELYRFAQCVAASGLAPKGMEKPESIVVAIQMGLEIGLAPMQAIQNIAVINGRATLWGDAVKALVESSGFCESIDEFPEGEGDARKWVCEAKRKDRNMVRREFSVADAKRANLWTKPGPWSQYPERMLQMRARSWALRDAFPDVLRGLTVREEMQDSAIDVTPARAIAKSLDADVAEWAQTQEADV